MDSSSSHGVSSRVRGLAVGDVIRRLVSKTLAKQFHEELESATSPQQFGLASHGGVEAAVYMLRVLTDVGWSRSLRPYQKGMYA